MSPEGVLSIVAGTDSWLRASGTMQAKNVMVELMTFLNVSKNQNTSLRVVKRASMYSMQYFAYCCSKERDSLETQCAYLLL